MKKLIPLLFLAACQSTADQPESGLKIAYNVLVDPESDNYEIFTMDMDGGNKTNISSHEAVDWTYYAHGDKIYFLSDRDTSSRVFFLYEMDANGENVRQVSDIRQRDSWFNSRNNGAEFIINPHRSIDSTGFMIITREGKRVRTVPIPLPYYSDPMFTHNGDQIVFRGATKKSKREEGFVDELYLINLDGSALTQLTHYPEGDSTVHWYDYNSGNAKWNASERFISYHSNQGGKYSLFGLNLDGTNQRKLTNLDWEEGWHEWSPDGKWLAIEVFDADQTQFHIGLLHWETMQFELLTDSSYTYQQAPVFVESVD